MEDFSIVRKANDFVFDLYKQELSRKLVYHTYKHTLEVVQECAALAEAYRLSPNDTETLLLAAWFHDTGYLDAYVGHEEASVKRVHDFLTQHNYPPDRLLVVENCILATRQGQKTQTLLEEILVDADMSNIGKESFFATAELLRVEWEIFLDKNFSQVEWEQFQLDFLLEHSFRTEKAASKFAAQYELNIQEQRKRLKMAEKKKLKKKEEKRETFAQPKRGVETMFRNVYRMHINLSAIADNKANMMISVNAIILSIIITYTGAKTASAGAGALEHRSLIIPLMVLLLTNLVSLIFAIISAQPEVTSMLKKGRPTTEKPDRPVNVLFFGNFTKISLPEFEKQMTELMRNKDGLYNNMVMDIYYLGDVLTRKYKLLKVSYAVFMVGLVLSVLTFVVVFGIQRL